jgi:hypothetical protein
VEALEFGRVIGVAGIAVLQEFLDLALLVFHLEQRRGHLVAVVVHLLCCTSDGAT